VNQANIKKNNSNIKNSRNTQTPVLITLSSMEDTEHTGSLTTH
jgi:hypothetical protein